MRHLESAKIRAVGGEAGSVGDSGRTGSLPRRLARSVVPPSVRRRLRRAVCGPGVAPNILMAHISEAPSAANAIGIFEGEWSSRLPPPLDGLPAGGANSFEDDRITWLAAALGGLGGMRVLELGPLEGGHTYGLDRAGVASTLAVESNTRAYLKCLIVKELLGMPSAHFVCGDFLPYLRTAEDRFDLCLASGVIYHLQNPAELIELSARVATRLFLWTHYYERDVIQSRPEVAELFTSQSAARHKGFRYTLHRREYGESLTWSGFCGGTRAATNWMTRTDLMACLDHFGWRVVETAFDHPDHPNGPGLAILAER